MSTRICLIHQYNVCKRLKIDIDLDPKRLFHIAASKSFIFNLNFNFKCFGPPVETGEALLAYVRALKHSTSVSTSHLYT